MNHDGEDNECKAEDEFIMTPSIRQYGDLKPNNFLYSNCSLRKLYSKIKDIYHMDRGT